MNNHAVIRSPLRPDGTDGDLPPSLATDAGDYEDASGIDIRAIWGIIYRNRFLIAAVTAAALLLGIVVTLLSTPIFEASSTVQIEQQASKVLETEDVEPTVSAQDAERFLQTQIDIIRSRQLAARVMDSLGLARDDKFLLAMGHEPSDETIGTLDAAASKRERILGVMADNLAVSLPRNSRIAKVSFDSPDPTLAARIANSYAQNFIMGNLQRRFDTSSYARNFLETQLAETKRKLEESERSMIGYARQARLIDASAGGSTSSESTGPRSLTTSNLVQLNQAYSQAAAGRVQAQQRWEQAQVTPLMNLPEVLSNPAIQQLTQKRAELRASYQEERQRRKADYPSVQQAAAEIAEIESQLNRLASSIKGSIRDQYLVALKQEQALNGSVSQLKGETLAEQDRSVQYNILRREVDTNRALYDGLLQRYKEVSAAAGITTNNISIIDVAETPTQPVSPRPLINMALAGMGGLALALMLAFARDKFDDAVRSPEDVGRKLGLPLLGSVPLLSSDQAPMDALSDPRSGFSESYFAIRTSVELASPNGLPRTLLLTSSRQSEGKSTSSFAIARDFARLGRRVLLVDSDLRKPSLHRLTGLSNQSGLASLLARQKNADEVIQKTNIANLDFLACGPLPPNPAELLASSSMSETLDRLSQTYDLLVIDGPPVLGLADAPTLAAVAGATIFVIEANGSHRGSAKAALKRLHSAHATLLGAILTKFDAKSQGYGADYGYSYNYRYGHDEGTQP